MAGENLYSEVFGTQGRHDRFGAIPCDLLAGNLRPPHPLLALCDHGIPVDANAAGKGERATISVNSAAMTMNTVKEIETALGKLTPQEREELRQWFDDHERPLSFL